MSSCNPEGATVPFTIQLEDCHPEGELVAILGHVTEGAFFGSELMLLRTRDGGEHPTCIDSYELESRGLAGAAGASPHHHRPHAPHACRHGHPLREGLGAVQAAAQRVSVSQVLAEPEFGANQLALHLSPDAFEDAGLEFMGVTAAAANAWYNTKLLQFFEAGIASYVRVELPRPRYIELEMMVDQDRIWIGESSGLKKVLLGYHSGHFSLPALRPEELLWLAQVTDSQPSNIPWLTATHPQDEAQLRPLAAVLSSRCRESCRAGRSR